MISLNLYDFGNNYIIEGKFDRVLLRPVSSLFQVLFEAFRIESLQEVATGVFCMWWATRHLHMPWTPLKFAMLFFFGNLRRRSFTFRFSSFSAQCRFGLRIASAFTRRCGT